jgi:hypothetical protein
MKRTLRILLPLWTLFFVTDFQSAVFANETETNEARLYAGFDGYQRAITTDSTEAQALFDQGMQLMYGFNHDEAGELSGRLTAAGSKADTFPQTSCFCGVGRGSVEDSEKVAN